MKVLILAGGYGTRIYPYTRTIPKPLIRIDGKPIIEHIIGIYVKYGFKDFTIATGYKGEEINKEMLSNKLTSVKTELMLELNNYKKK